MQRYLLWGIKTQLLFEVVSVISSKALEYIYQTSKGHCSSVRRL